MTGQEIEQSLDDMARKYVETHDHELIKELYALASCKNWISNQIALSGRVNGFF